MSVRIKSKIRSMAADGYFSEHDLAAAAEDMVDGRGITPTEKTQFENTIEDLIYGKGDVRVPSHVTDAYREIKDRIEDGYCRADNVYGQGLDGDEIRAIVDRHMNGGSTPVENDDVEIMHRDDYYFTRSGVMQRRLMSDIEGERIERRSFWWGNRR